MRTTSELVRSTTRRVTRAMPTAVALARGASDARWTCVAAKDNTKTTQAAPAFPGNARGEPGRRKWTRWHKARAFRRKPRNRYCRLMIELFRSNDPVVISFAEALLSEAGIEHATLDVNMSIM